MAEITDVTRPMYDIFPTQIQDISTDHLQYIDYRDVNLNDANSVQEYRIEINDRVSYFLPNKSYLEYRFQLLKTNGTAFGNGDNVSLQNNAVGLMQRYEFLFDDKIADSVDEAQIVNTVQKCVYYSDSQSNTIASQQLWYPDTNNTTNKDYTIVNGNSLYSLGIDTVNLGHRKRQNLLNASRTFAVHIPLKDVLGFFKSYQEVTKGIKLGVRLIRNNDSNLMMGTAGQVKMLEVKWWIPKVKPNVTVLPQLEAKLNSGGNYYTDFIDVQSYRSNRISELATNKIFQIRAKRKRPVKVFCVFQLASRHDGDHTQNKRIFDTVDVNELRLTLNGTTQYPEREYKTSFTANADNYARVYSEYLRCGLKDHDIDQGSVVTFDTFKSLYPIFCFDLSERLEHSVVQDSALIDFYWSTGSHAADYYVWIFIESEVRAQFSTSGGQMKLLNITH